MESSACKICFHQLEGPDRRPRFLGCGHSFCSSCIIKIMYNDRVKCPICFKIQGNVKQLEDLPIAYDLEEIVGAMALSKPKVPPKPKAIYANVPKQDSNEDENLQCKEHKYNNIFYCDNHKVFICHVCTIVEHPGSKCKVITKEEAIDQKRISYSFTIEQLLKSTSELTARYRLYKNEIEACKEQHKELTVKLTELAKKHSDQANTLDQSCNHIQDVIEEFGATLIQIETIKIDLSCTKSLNEVIEVKKKINPLLQAHNKFWKEKWVWHEKYIEVQTAREDISTELKELIGKEKEELKKSTNRACNLEGGAQKSPSSQNRSGQKDTKSGDFELHIPNIFKRNIFKNSRK